jgi:hypothetical protein
MGLLALLCGFYRDQPDGVGASTRRFSNLHWSPRVFQLGVPSVGSEYGGYRSTTAISPPGADGSRQVRHNVGGSLVVFNVLLSQARNDSRYEFCQSTAFRRRCAGFEFVERRPECNA